MTTAMDLYEFYTKHLKVIKPMWKTLAESMSIPINKINTSQCEEFKEFEFCDDQACKCQRLFQILQTDKTYKSYKIICSDGRRVLERSKFCNRLNCECMDFVPNVLAGDELANKHDEELRLRETIDDNGKETNRYQRVKTSSTGDHSSNKSRDSPSNPTDDISQGNLRASDKCYSNIERADSEDECNHQKRRSDDANFTNSVLNTKRYHTAESQAPEIRLLFDYIGELQKELNQRDALLVDKKSLNHMKIEQLEKELITCANRQKRQDLYIESIETEHQLNKESWEKKVAFFQKERDEFFLEKIIIDDENKKMHYRLMLMEKELEKYKEEDIKRLEKMRKMLDKSVQTEESMWKTDSYSMNKGCSSAPPSPASFHDRDLLMDKFERETQNLKIEYRKLKNSLLYDSSVQMIATNEKDEGSEKIMTKHTREVPDTNQTNFKATFEATEKENRKNKKEQIFTHQKTCLSNGRARDVLHSYKSKNDACIYAFADKNTYQNKTSATSSVEAAETEVVIQKTKQHTKTRKGDTLIVSDGRNVLRNQKLDDEHLKTNQNLLNGSEGKNMPCCLKIEDKQAKTKTENIINGYEARNMLHNQKSRQKHEKKIESISKSKNVPALHEFETAKHNQTVCEYESKMESVMEKQQFVFPKTKTYDKKAVATGNENKVRFNAYGYQSTNKRDDMAAVDQYSAIFKSKTSIIEATKHINRSPDEIRLNKFACRRIYNNEAESEKEQSQQEINSLDSDVTEGNHDYSVATDTRNTQGKAARSVSGNQIHSVGTDTRNTQVEAARSVSGNQIHSVGTDTRNTQVEAARIVSGNQIHSFEIDTGNTQAAVDQSVSGDQRHSIGTDKGETKAEVPRSVSDNTEFCEKENDMSYISPPNSEMEASNKTLTYTDIDEIKCNGLGAYRLELLVEDHMAYSHQDSTPLNQNIGVNGTVSTVVDIPNTEKQGIVTPSILRSPDRERRCSSKTERNRVSFKRNLTEVRTFERDYRQFQTNPEDNEKQVNKQNKTYNRKEDRGDRMNKATSPDNPVPSVYKDEFCLQKDDTVARADAALQNKSITKENISMCTDLQFSDEDSTDSNIVPPTTQNKIRDNSNETAVTEEEQLTEDDISDSEFDEISKENPALIGQDNLTFASRNAQLHGLFGQSRTANEENNEEERSLEKNEYLLQTQYEEIEFEDEPTNKELETNSTHVYNMENVKHTSVVQNNDDNDNNYDSITSNDSFNQIHSETRKQEIAMMFSVCQSKPNVNTNLVKKETTTNRKPSGSKSVRQKISGFFKKNRKDAKNDKHTSRGDLQTDQVVSNQQSCDNLKFHHVVSTRASKQEAIQIATEHHTNDDTDQTAKKTDVPKKSTIKGKISQFFKSKKNHSGDEKAIKETKKDIKGYTNKTNEMLERAKQERKERNENFNMWRTAAKEKEKKNQEAKRIDNEMKDLIKQTRLEFEMKKKARQGQTMQVEKKSKLEKLFGSLKRK